MKQFLKLLFLIIIFIAIATFSYLKFYLPDVGAAPVLKISVSPASIARGRYLANNVMVCMDCHSTRDNAYFAAPVIAGTEGKGGEKFD